MARLIGRLAAVLLLLAGLAIAGHLLREFLRRHPQDVPWTALDLDDPVGRFTAGKLAALADDPGRCLALLDRDGARAAPVRMESSRADCPLEGTIRLAPGDVPLRPAAPILSCPLAAGLRLFDRQAVQPAALRHLGQPVSRIEHLGTFSCRRVGGRADAPFSEHARANAVDVAAFVLADGRRISVARDWDDDGAAGAFLRAVRERSCALFPTVLSPEYNAAHADHLHLDLAARGLAAPGACR